jgi:2-dehydro-3-deoxyphosphogluconate aldolase / (4S)-4-hydroxy-2-oxoglutarate aldolase
MDKSHTLSRIRSTGLLAVIRGPSPELTLQTVAALVRGGVTGIEITYTTPQAPQVVRQLRSEYGEGILLGMGTLTEVQQAGEALEAGAEFLVSPHCDPELAGAMLGTGLPVMIGALTPSEVFQAHRLGADFVKIFPGSLVGPAYIKALRGPFPDIPLVPTGGVSLENIGDWMAAGVAAVGVGGELCPTSLALEGRFDEITARAEKYSTAIHRARL